MEALRVVPKIFYFDTFKEFNEELEFKPGVNVINFVTDAPKVNAPNDERNLYFRNFYPIY